MLPQLPDIKALTAKLDLEEIKLRDQFAIEILKKENIKNWLDHDIMAVNIYRIADSMIKARENYLK